MHMLLSRNDLLRFGLIKYLLNQLHALVSDICVIELGLESKLSYFEFVIFVQPISSRLSLPKCLNSKINETIHFENH